MLAAALVTAACVQNGPNPGPTQLIPAATHLPGPSPTATPTDPSAAPTERPLPTVQPTTEPTVPPSAIVSGSVDRTSMDVTATYAVNAAITVATGSLDVTTRIDVRNDSGEPIDRLELNTIAARLGNMRITESTVDDVRVPARIADQTIIVPLGGVLPDGASATLRIAYRATLRKGRLGDDWRFSRSGGTLALSRWIPWVSRAMPFARPNSGEPYVTGSSPQVDVEILTDAPMVLAAPTTEVDAFAAGAGNDWAFTLHDVRDAAVVLAPDFKVSSGTAGETRIRAYTRPGGLSGATLVKQAAAAITAEAKLLGVAFPGDSLTIVETEGGVALESPGMVWVPGNLTTLNRTYAIYQGAAQQWFGALVGNDQRNEPFADEAPADLLARTVMDLHRATRCAKAPLDRSVARYSRQCYYEVVYVQGGLVLDAIRSQMGTSRFWKALGGYLEANRNGLGGTRQLLESLRVASEANLTATLRARFPDLY